MIKTWTDNDLIYFIEQVDTLAELCRLLNLVPIGGNYTTLKRAIVRLNLDTSHFKGQAWSKDNWSDAPNHKNTIKKKLLRERGHACQRCTLTFWEGLLVPLELEHIDGNPNNNRDSNLLLLCCNCHALTPTWRNRKR